MKTAEIAKVIHRPLENLSSAFQKTLMTTVGITAISFLSSVATARMLGPQGRGLLSAALMIGALSSGIAQMGLANTFVYHAGAGKTLPYLKLWIGSVIVIIMLAVGLACGGIYLSSNPELRLMLPPIIALSIFSGLQVYFLILSQLRTNLHFFNSIRFGLVAGNALLLLPIALFFGRNVTFVPILYAQVSVVAMLTVAGIVWSYKNKVWQLPNAGDSASIAEIARYGFHQHGNTLLSLLLTNFDKIVLLNRASMEEFGYYAMAFTTSRLIGMVQEALSIALFSRFAGRDIAILSEKVRTAFRITFVPLLLIAALGSLLSPWLIVWTYGVKFAPMALPFSILLFECVISGASVTLVQRFAAAGRPDLILLRQFISVAMVFAAMPFLPEKNIYIYLSLLMLAGSILRLSVTLVMYSKSLKEPIPGCIPTRADLHLMLAQLRNLKKNKSDDLV